MSYRKIVVDNQEYEYTVGASMLKVKGIGAVFKEEVGEPVWIGDEEKLMITRKHVAAWIRQHASKS